MKTIYLSLIMAMLSALATAQPLPHKYSWAAYGKYYISSSNYDYSGVTKEITQEGQTDYERAELIYRWICNNISYDPTNTVRTADRCWDTRKGVCQAYCELYYRMAKTIGIKVELVGGKVKSRRDGRTIEHVWLQIKTDKGKILADPTWGAGIMVQTAFFNNCDMQWFDVSPENMIYTHFPDRTRYLLLPETIDEATFLSMPFLTPKELSAQKGTEEKQ